MPPTVDEPHRRWWLLPTGFVLGLALASLPPSTSGCVYHDTCIKVTSPGHDWCRNLALAKKWPIGSSFDDAESILRPDGAAPRGCRCYNDAEHQIFSDEAPECRLDAFLAALEQAAREECQSLVPPGYDHNCWTTAGSQASIAEGHFRQGDGACIGNCEYGSPPAGGSCPNPSPYECADGGGTDGNDGGCASEGGSETGTTDSGLDETGSDTSAGVTVEVDGFVSCDDQDCEIDEAFARALQADPTPLLDQGAVLVYDPGLQRHVLHGVEPGSILHALGLRNRDRLESIDGLIIHDLDSALRVYTELAAAEALTVRIKRGKQWLDLTYTLVP
ncbi:PDZ domain-containing protein [Paraliomyxa miuraensis]|uniref:hypothetical protein n=1 Tax=Paraliomyxa miuraensis TaxID=376150 RepID=UPI00225973E4|nr:hypothetical protein [Paraliomyxa miuraensis]MCX4242030.1 hypothetical protein [Paraliomyxa miuraensis]